MVNNPYEVLGVSQDASMDEIKQAYRKKAKECHPDLHPDDPTANARMQQVNEAYDRLCNPEKYASQRQAPGGNPYGNPYANPYASQNRQYGQGARYAYYTAADSEDFWRAWQTMWNESPGPEPEPKRRAAPVRPFRGLFRVMAGLLLFRFLLSMLRVALFGFFF